MTMRFTFKALTEGYDRYNKLDTKALYESLGWNDLIGKPEWANTCAVRMSLALLECGVNVQGRVRINDGVHKGKMIEPGQNRLADYIARHVLGEPVKYDRKTFFETAYREVWNQTGIISFMRIPAYAGGHIDVLDARGDWQCRRSCYFSASEVWFWLVQ